MGLSPHVSASGSTPDSGKERVGVAGSYFLHHFAISGVSVAAATGFTHPLDVLKVRLQMQLVGQRGPLAGMAELFQKLLRVEGPLAFYSGLIPALARSVLYGGLRLGLYEPCKHACEMTFGSANFLLKVASGSFSGAVAAALTNPTEVLKVRMQMSLVSKNVGTIGALQKIVLEEGIGVFWKGVGPAMIRAATLTASQLATYDESKQALMKWALIDEGFYLHLVSSMVSGAVGTLITAPMDMIKTRLMLQHGNRGVDAYKNALHCLYKVVVMEGPRSLYKGGLTVFARLGPQTVIIFIMSEKLRDLCGMQPI